MKRFHFFSRFLMAGILILAACTAVSEEPAAQPNNVATIALTRAVPEATATVATDNPSPTPAPTATVPPEPTAVPTAEPVEAETLSIANTIQFTQVNQWGGVLNTIAVANNIAYVGAGARLVAIDMSNPDQPVQLGQSDLLPDHIRDIVLIDGAATVANGRGGIARFDISDPFQIRLLSQTTEFNDSPSRIGSIAAAGDQIFATSYEPQSGQGYLIVVDADNLQFQTSQALSNISRVYVHEGVLYLLGYDNLQTFSPDNISQPLDRLDFAASSWQPTLVFQNDLAAISPVMPGGLQMVDIRDPANLQAVGEVADDGTFRMGGTAVAAADTVFMGGTFGEFGYCSSSISAFDVSEPARPQAGGEFDPQNCINDMALAGETLLVAGRRGLQLYDAADPANLILRSTFVPEDGLMDAQSVAVNGRTTYITDAQGSGAKLAIYEATEAGSLNRLSDLIDLEAGFVNNAYLQDQTYIAPIWQDGIRLVNINDPAQPTLNGRLTGEEMQMGDFLVSALFEGYLYLPVYGGQGSSIAVIDVRDPARLAIVNEVKAVHPTVVDVAQADGRLVVLNQEASQIVQIFDLSDPANPVELGQIELPRSYGRVAVVGDYLYAACDIWNCHHLAIINISDPAQATLVKEFDMPLGVIKMMPVDGQTIILAVNGDGLYALDVTEPEEPVLAGHHPIAGEYFTFTTQGNEIMVAAQDAGLYQIQLSR